MAKFRKKPVVIEAVQWTGEYFDVGHFPDWLFLACEAGRIADNGDCKTIETLEGTHTASPGDFIIQGIKGELYPCKDQIFRETYEAVTEGEGG